ncbi:MAG: copper resistance protein CopC [Actinomycetota bacterium]|nr:copper resistance protein CopC [Actinomycetota bacterium]
MNHHFRIQRAQRGFGRRITTLSLLTVGRVVVWALVVGLALLGSSSAAAAHNVLIGSDPPEGAKLATGPARVVLTFDLPVQPGFSTVTVTGPDGNQWQAGVATEDGAVVSAPVRPLGPAGQYIIAYQVLSADGHPVRGAVRFTLTKPGTGVAAAPNGSSEAPAADRSGATSSTATRTGSGSTPVWPWLLGAGVLLAIGVVVALRVGRSS